MKNFKLTNYPECIFTGTWLLAVLLYSLTFDPISLSVFIYVCSFIFFFVIGSVFFGLFRFAPKVPRFTSVPMLSFVVVFLMLISIFYAVQIFIFLLNSESAISAFSEIRQSALQGTPVMNSIPLFVNANQILFGLSSFGYILLQKAKAGESVRYNNKLLYSEQVGSIHLFTAGIFISLVVSLLDASRSFFLNSLLTLLFVLIQLDVIKLRQITIFVFIVLFLFSITFPIFRPDVSSLSEGFKYTSLYFSGGLGSLDNVMRGDTEVYWGDFEALANKLGAIGLPYGGYDLQSLKMDYADLPGGYNTNVYTALGVYHEYFGYAAFLIAFFIGGFVRYLCFISNKSLFGFYFYPFYLSALVFSVFHDYFLSVTYFLFKILLVLFSIAILERLLNSMRFVFKLRNN